MIQSEPEATTGSVPDAAAIGAALLLADLQEAVIEATAQLTVLSAAMALPLAPIQQRPPPTGEVASPAAPAMDLLPMQLPQATPVVWAGPSIVPGADAVAAPYTETQPAAPPISSLSLDQPVTQTDPFPWTAPVTEPTAAPEFAPMQPPAPGSREATWMPLPDAPMPSFVPATSAAPSNALPEAGAWTTPSAAPGSSDPWPSAATPPVAATPQPSSAGGSAAPPPRSSAGPTGGDVFLDGVRVGRWLADTLAREAGGPATGGTGFDPRLGPTWPGALQGNGS